MGSESYHEGPDTLSEEAKDLHRAIVSLTEELDAIDWYGQRAEVTPNESLRAILIHHRNDEIEHAMMLLEWIRRKSPMFDANMRRFLFSQESIVDIEKAKGEQAPRLVASPRIGSLKGA